MQNPRRAIRWQGLIWTLLLLLGLALMILTLVYVLESDESNRSQVQAFLVSDQQIVVLHSAPEASSGIAGLLPGNRWINVLEYDPVRNPGWVRIEASGETGWVPLDRLETGD
jgi:hypothetical protein